jgi:hypothetical protein
MVSGTETLVGGKLKATRRILSLVLAKRFNRSSDGTVAVQSDYVLVFAKRR